MKLMIVRHGDPDYARDSLTERGRREAELLADGLEKLDFAAIYVSPLGRARETAEATLRRLGRTGETKDWLREFAPTRFDPDLGHPTILWDWLPQKWTAEKAFYDREEWMHVPVMVSSGAPAEAKWVHDGLDEVLAAHGYAREGDIFRAERPNRDTLLFFAISGWSASCWGICWASPPCPFGMGPAPSPPPSPPSSRRSGGRGSPPSACPASGTCPTSPPPGWSPAFPPASARPGTARKNATTDMIRRSKLCTTN